jgi:hypothetical protein
MRALCAQRVICAAKPPPVWPRMPLAAPAWAAKQVVPVGYGAARTSA